MAARPVSGLSRSHPVLFIMFAGHARFLVLRSRRVDGRRTFTRFLNRCTICFKMEMCKLHNASAIIKASLILSLVQVFSLPTASLRKNFIKKEMPPLCSSKLFLCVLPATVTHFSLLFCFRENLKTGSVATLKDLFICDAFRDFGKRSVPELTRPQQYVTIQTRKSLSTLLYLVLWTP